ncbi:MAG TPA: DUF4400 domain-containing protein [Bryobacteraceae bacterium]|nr:DUF4400 domain-containing protein [Bryobacteraceae bacterium]
MKLVWIGALLLLLASVARLVSNAQSGTLIKKSWITATDVLPDSELGQLQCVTPAYTAGIFARLPQPLRQKFSARMWQALELMILRSLMLWYVTPAFLIVTIAGFLEGRWARSNQKALVKMHSPMRFSLALAGLAFTPVLVLLWITAPVAVPPTPLVLTLGTLAAASARNLVVHAPTQF